MSNEPADHLAAKGLDVPTWAVNPEHIRRDDGREVWIYYTRSLGRSGLVGIAHLIVDGWSADLRCSARGLKLRVLRPLTETV